MKVIAPRGVASVITSARKDLQVTDSVHLVETRLERENLEVAKVGMVGEV